MAPGEEIPRHVLANLPPGTFLEKSTSCGRVARASALALAAALLVLACDGAPEPPEARIRALLAEVKLAAEAGDLAPVRDAVSADYRDTAGRDRRALMAFLTLRRMQQSALFLLVREDSLVVREGGASANVVLRVAMAGTPITAPQDLAGLRAGVWRVDLELAEEDDDWRVVDASWRPAPAFGDLGDVR